MAKDYEATLFAYRESTKDLDEVDKNPEDHERLFMKVITFGCGTDSPIPTKAISDTYSKMRDVAVVGKDENDIDRWIALDRAGVSFEDYCESIYDSCNNFSKKMHDIAEKYGISDPRWDMQEYVLMNKMGKMNDQRHIAVSDKAFPHAGGGTCMGPVVTIYGDGRWAGSVGLEHVRDEQIYEANLLENTGRKQTLTSRTDIAKDEIAKTLDDAPKTLDEVENTIASYLEANENTVELEQTLGA